MYEIEIDSIIQNSAFSVGACITTLWNHLLLLSDFRYSHDESNPTVYDMQHLLANSQNATTCAFVSMHENNKNGKNGEESCETSASTLTPSLLTHEVHEAYRKDGVVAIRNLIASDVLQRLREAGDELISFSNNNVNDRSRQIQSNASAQRYTRNSQFHTVKSGVIFPENTGAAARRNVSLAFQNVGLHGLVPYVAAELLFGVGAVSNNKTSDDEDVLEINGHGNNIRLLRDIFLAKDEGKYVCGWHVDDYGFWPATPASDGVNAWIALDNMTLNMGGGFAVSPGSHKASWRQAAYRAIGATPTFPLEGFRSAGDMFENRVGHGTCNLEDGAPEIHRKLEQNKRIFDVQAGDVLFLNRWVWHKTVPFKKNDNVANYSNLSNDGNYPPILKRYSIRYAPGTAVSPKGFGTEFSILWNEENAGKTLDDISSTGSPWYPKVFPSVDLDEMKLLPNFMGDKFEMIENRLKQRKREMQPFLSNLQKHKRLKAAT
eukprot:CAMPEP_0196814004 /NCGR_PEP_ID=MMETSP1362-20130617/40762_1 /TAXON_ID=163516 /ORGANISM="Leptocylindrus danicus, Strain CCMP1856" /LENGTH=488 /DNA_ID=CAMNT_0042190481 /DNA_START=218 /DNA_END=1684 /DNA_ORIENTATION=-